MKQNLIGIAEAQKILKANSQRQARRVLVAIASKRVVVNPRCFLYPKSDVCKLAKAIAEANEGT